MCLHPVVLEQPPERLQRLDGSHRLLGLDPPNVLFQVLERVDRAEWGLASGRRGHIRRLPDGGGLGGFQRGRRWRWSQEQWGLRMSDQTGNLKGETGRRISFDWRVEWPPFPDLSGQSSKPKATLMKLKVLFGQSRRSKS